MSRPTPGRFYTVQPGDTLRNIARAAYGNDQGARLARANGKRLQDRGISREGYPYLYPGDRLWIPPIPRAAQATVPALADNEFSVRIGDREFHGVKTTSITRALNSIADSFVFEAPFDPRNREHVEAFRPFGYQPAALYVGGELYIAGQMINVRFKSSTTGRTVTAEVRTKSGDLIECHGDRGIIEHSNITLLAMAEEIAEPYGMRAFSATGSEGGRFESAVKEADETDFDFLARLASQKGYLVTSSYDGNLLLTRAAVDERPVASLIEGSFPVRSVTAAYDSTRRFSHWYGWPAVTSGQFGHALIEDRSIPVLRHFAFMAGESDTSTIEDAVRWRVAKSIADAASIDVVVSGFRDSTGELWRENRKVILEAPSVMVNAGTEFIVRAVRLQSPAEDGDTTTLSLVLPGAYNLEIPESYPWDGFPS